MKTFTELKELVSNPHYPLQRRKSLRDLTDDMLDLPIIHIINGFNKLPYCFTLQSCYGHFIHADQTDDHNLESLSVKHPLAGVKYRIAYLAFCIENCPLGRGLFEALREIPEIDPENIQFGCAEWFWKRQINSYTLQVVPDRFKDKDTAILDVEEALHIEKIRNSFFIGIQELLEAEVSQNAAL